MDELIVKIAQMIREARSIEQTDEDVAGDIVALMEREISDDPSLWSCGDSDTRPKDGDAKQGSTSE